MASISPTQSNAQQALAAFLSAVLPGVPGQQPAVFTGVVEGTTLTVSGLPNKQPAGIQGTIQPNSPLLGLGVAPGTVVLQQLSQAPGAAPGGVGTYQVSISQTTPNPATMSTGVSIVAGQANRVGEPANPYFAVFTPIGFERVETNFDQWADIQFRGSIAGAVLTVASVAFGEVLPGAMVFGTGVLSGTLVVSQISGEVGGPGTYSVAPSQSATTQTMASGAEVITQGAIATIQIDYHGPDTLAGDFAQTVSTLLRDEFGTTFFANLAAPLSGVTPLYCDDPNQRPFISAENTFEWRWSADCKLFVAQAVSVPQQFFTSADVTPVSVEVAYPP